jgi:hypothetical protein
MMSMNKVFLVTAVVEAGAGAALAAFPSATIALLLGSPLDTSAAVAVGRVAGTALLALAVASWFAHGDQSSRAARGLLAAMVLYNLASVVVLGWAGLKAELVGIALWPTVLLHAAMTVWCLARLKTRTAPQ